MTQLEQYIQSYFGMRENDLLKIRDLFQAQTLKKGDFYTKTGRICDRLSFIQSGLVRIYVDLGEKEVTQWVSSKGYFVTDLSSLIFKTPARWNIQAITDCELYTINKKDYDAIGGLVPQWHELEKLFIARCFTILEDRIFRHLSMSAEERYEAFYEQNKELFTQVPQQYLASLLGMTPETFSRIRKKALG
jgi:CRP/FNR family transcriptional regulator, anaerobic regulatory protein